MIESSALKRLQDIFKAMSQANAVSATHNNKGNMLVIQFAGFIIHNTWYTRI